MPKTTYKDDGMGGTWFYRDGREPFYAFGDAADEMKARATPAPEPKKPSIYERAGRPEYWGGQEEPLSPEAMAANEKRLDESTRDSGAEPYRELKSTEDIPEGLSPETRAWMEREIKAGNFGQPEYYRQPKESTEPTLPGPEPVPGSKPKGEPGLYESAKRGASMTADAIRQEISDLQERLDRLLGDRVAGD